MNPKIKILLATYNRAHLIEEMLHSIQKQTYTDFECLVTDDNSIDNTTEVVEKFCEQDQRFNYLKKPQKYPPGLSSNRNFGLDSARGAFIVFCDDDDVMHPQHLETCMHFIESDHVDFVHFRKQSFTDKIPDRNKVSVLDLEQTKISEEHIADVINQKLALASCTVMWKKKAIGEERFKKYLNYAEEWEFYTRLILNGAKGVQIDAILYFNRKHPNSNTGEFFLGSSKRMQSKIEASKLIITNLNKNKSLSPELIHFFCWESVRYKSVALFQHLTKQSSLSKIDKLKVRALYIGSPLIKVWLRSRKKLNQ